VKLRRFVLTHTALRRPNKSITAPSSPALTTGPSPTTGQAPGATPPPAGPSPTTGQAPVPAALPAAPSPTTGLVSIVIPVYNVETYVEDCLRSVLAQTFSKLEIIAVIDGATDSSEEIVRRVAAHHPQIRVITQENAGLSAARNAGAAVARGEFLWFVDSDDVLNERAAEKMVTSLRSSKSDFVVASYYRFNSTRRWNAGSWVQNAHRIDRKATTIDKFPEILCSAVAWNKMYRREFWTKCGLQFPVGQIYEDQEVSAKAYAYAKKFDVLHAQLYGWRAREDNSSISQQTLELRDVQGRLRAIQASIRVLDLAGKHQAARVRLLQFLNNDFQHSAKDFESVSDEYWDALRVGLQTLTKGMKPSEWAQVKPRFACLEWLVLEDRRNEAELYLRQQGTNANQLAVSWRNGWLVAHVPFWDSPELSIPDHILAVTPEEWDLRHSIRRAYWNADEGFLCIQGWAYLDGFDLTQNTSGIAAALVSGGMRIPLEVGRHQDDYVDFVSTNEANDYRNGGFDLFIYPDALPDSPLTADYDIELSVTLRGLSRTVKASSVNRWSSAFHAAQGTSLSGARVGLIFPTNDSVQVRLTHPQFAVEGIRVDGNLVRGVVRTNRWATTQPQALTISPSSSPNHILVSASLSCRDADSWDFVIPIPSIDWRKPGDLLARIVTSSGAKDIIDWRDPPHMLPLSVADTGFAITRNRTGNLTGFGLAESALRIDSVEFKNHVLRMTGQSLWSDQPRCVLSLSDHRSSHRGVMSWNGSDFLVEFPLWCSAWGQKEAPLPTGRYALTAASEMPEEGASSSKHQPARPPALHIGSAVQQGIPFLFDSAALKMRFELAPSGIAQLVVDPPLRPGEQGKRCQRSLQTRIPTLGSGIRDDTILLRSYYGETATCNPLGIHRAIVAAGLDMNILWGVADRSVVVPQAGHQVVIGSTQWYEALATAKYQVHNVHQPDYVHKLPGQVIIQTLHGYPFKLAGLPYWKSSGFSPERIKSFLERQAEWDYLISPAPYATELLNETFPFGGEMLEIGYPRNDIFFSPRKDAIRARTRKALEIPDGVTAVLYAPTYRDSLAASEFRADLVHFFDEEDLAGQLGEGYMVLMRGHGMNARTEKRFSSGSNVIDVTDYPRIEELCLASDVGVMDYSSLRFDYAITGKPMVFFVPDLEQYLDTTRGSLIPYEPTAPGPFARSQEDLLSWLHDIKHLSEEFLVQRAQFAAEFSVWEDGGAGQRFIEAVIRP
jgi:CDP-glycerol glycerophosphotransferase